MKDSIKSLNDRINQLNKLIRDANIIEMKMDDVRMKLNLDVMMDSKEFRDKVKRVGKYMTKIHDKEIESWETSEREVEYFDNFGDPERVNHFLMMFDDEETWGKMQQFKDDGFDMSDNEIAFSFAVYCYEDDVAPMSFCTLPLLKMIEKNLN